jgi:hypothetical protein
VNQTITKEEYERLLACAVEVQALREALRRIGALHSETRTGIRGEPKGETWSAFADRLQREAAAALSAPSESERVLAARDERTRADERAKQENGVSILKALLGGAPDLPLADALSRHDERKRAAALEEAATVIEDVDPVEHGRGYMRADDSPGTIRACAAAVRALAATPPSAASGTPPTQPGGAQFCDWADDCNDGCAEERAGHARCLYACHRAASGKGAPLAVKFAMGKRVRSLLAKDGPAPGVRCATCLDAPGVDCPDCRKGRR